jgi:transcriptional regulator of acetoin/glycerol metabolism
MREQALMSAYIVESRKRGSDAVIVMDERTTIASRGALEMLSDSDYGVLAGYAQESTHGGRAFDREVALMNGSQVTVTARPIESTGDRSGSLLRLRRPVVPSGTQHREIRRARPDGFDRLVGQSTALQRALEVASTAVDRRQAAYIVGEGGAGKSELAFAIASRLQPAVTVFETNADHPVLKGGIAAVRSAIDRGSAIIVKRADHLPAETRADLAALFSASSYAPVVLTYARPIRLNDTGLVDSLQAVEIEMPPLRARRDDIPQLIHHFLCHNGHGVLSASSAVVQAAVKAEWSGNVRQLKNFIDTVAARCPTGELDIAHLSDGQRRLLSTMPLSRLEEAELHQIREALADSGGNRVRAAALLQIGRSTLYRKITAYERRGYELDK